MTTRLVRLQEDVYNALYELKYDYRERTLSDTLAHLLHELGLEPDDEDERDDE